MLAREERFLREVGKFFGKGSPWQNDESKGCEYRYLGNCWHSPVTSSDLTNLTYYATRASLDRQLWTELSPYAIAPPIHGSGLQGTSAIRLQYHCLRQCSTRSARSSSKIGRM